MCKQFLFLGIGGMGMAPLSSYVRQRGDIVYGFDDALSVDLERFFEGQKIVICEQFPENIDNVIFSSAVQEDHPWMRMAKERKIPTIRRGYFLAKFCRQKRVIAITGSHGKTTTTGMLIDHLPNCDYILGGFFQNKNKLPASYKKENKYLICEVDESDRTIEAFQPYITATINLEDDHLDTYGQSKYLDDAFEKIFSQTERVVIIPENNERLCAIAQRLNIPIFFAKLSSQAKENFHLQNGAIVKSILEILLAELDSPTILPEVSYSPIFRRNQFLGYIYENQVMEIWADYAHHPTEIIHYIEKFRHENSDKKILFIFQPHRYSRTKQYARDFAKIFEDKDALLIAEYSAGETFILEGTTQSIMQYLSGIAKVKYSNLLKDFNFQEFSESNIFDIILFIGAGDIYQQAQDWLFTQRVAHLKKILTSCAIAFQENFLLKYRNTFQVDAIAPLWIEPQSETELQTLIQYLQSAAISHIVIGRSSNLLLDDFKGVYISLKKMPTILEITPSQITVSSQIVLGAFAKRMATLGLQGCESLTAIPGTIGGALYMNAGAHQQSIFDHLISIKFLDFSGEIKTILKDEIDFSYRHGFREGIILSAQFSFTQQEAPEVLLEKIRTRIQWRREKQPSEANAGSIFKNPENYFAGVLIEQAGLKAMSIGGATVSPVHANFIVNCDQKATVTGIKRLLRFIRQKVFEKHRIFLEREILFASDHFLHIL
ncbi:MAG: UDP-N-acetylmuramate dehydrogenase [Puniceicoccales bacterium]|jgi:UDP-N-acetylenolpyruvoylglucosamine reductase|nr:UDP-N-acetylmuramate dehydrogenase [Puniceicoccales bacterium]